MNNLESKEVGIKNNNMKEGSGDGGGDNENEERENSGVAENEDENNNNDKNLKMKMKKMSPEKKVMLWKEPEMIRPMKVVVLVALKQLMELHL